MLTSGGVFFWVLLLLLVIALIMFVERFMDLRRARIDVESFVLGVTNVLDKGGEDEALAICADTSAPAAAVVEAAVRNLHAPARVMREAVDAQGRAEVGRLDRRLASLAIIGQISPIIGLLGTVVGFIHTLLAANAQPIVSRPELFMSATKTLTVAAAGLAVSVAVAVLYGMLRIRLDRLVVELEAAASRIIGHIATLTEVRR